MMPLSPLVALLMVLMVSTAAFAQEPAGKGDPWQFGLSLYGWFPDITGQTAFTPDGGGNDFVIDIDQILDNLQFFLMGTFDLRKGRWGLLTDGVYMDVGNSKNGVRGTSIGDIQLPADADANVDLDLQSLIWTIAGYFRALDRPGKTLDIVAGFRYLDVEQKVNWEVTGNVGSIPVGDRTGTAEASLANWDMIFGFRGKLAFGAKRAWFVPYYLDIGFGDSDLTWQGIAGMGYAFHWGEVVAVWRYLYYDLQPHRAIADISFNGPAIGVSFRW